MLIKSKKSLIVSLIVFVVVVLAGTELYLRSTWDDPTIIGNIPEVGPIEIKGTYVCLPHKQKRSLFRGRKITLECAFGFKGEDGNYYGLRSVNRHDDPIGTTAQLEISGTFSDSIPRGMDKYDVIGFLDVEDYRVISKPSAPYIP